VIVRYLDPLERLEHEIIQRQEEGSDFKNLEDAFLRLNGKTDADARIEAHKILADLMERDAVTPSVSVSEPNDLDVIRSLAPKIHVSTSSPLHLNETELYDKVLGGWLGRAAGCLLGKPVERYKRSILREMLQSNDEWPLTNYWTEKGMPQEVVERYPWKQRLGFESLRENIECMPEDDDLNYVMLNLHVMETHGYNFTSNDIATAWLTTMPAFQVFTAERVAYFNLLNGYEAPKSATHMNPFREWIGAQIRSDLWGYTCQGNPSLAAELAWRDACISHTRNGIYGEMFFSALIALAFTEENPRILVESALAYIPKESRLANAINFVLSLSVHSMEWEAVLDRLHAHFGAYHWVHSINNTALTVAALLAGDGGYEKTICNTVMGGWDTDSNGATAGSIIGVMKGAKALPSKWIGPLNNKIRSSLAGFDNSNFTDLAHRTIQVMQQSKNNNSKNRATARRPRLSEDF